MYETYIIYSQNFDRYYIGSTEDVGIRLKRHNDRKVKSTKAYVPWQLCYKEEFETRAEAYRREKQIKSYKGGRAFKELMAKSNHRIGQTAPPKNKY